MKFVPVNNNVLVERVNAEKEIVEENGIAYERKNVELYRIIEISLLPDYGKPFPFSVGDIITCRATGTEIAGTNFKLMNPDYITAKIL